MAQMKKTAKAAPAKAKPTPNKTKMGLIQDITNRFSVTAREARDIVTAVGTYGTLKFNPDSQYDRYSTRKIEQGKAVKNIKKQISETVTAAKTGKKGTSSGQAGMGDGEVPYTYFTGPKRK